MTGRLKSNYKGWNKLKRKLKTFGYERSVDAGFFADAKYGPDNDNLQVAQVAAWNDFGSPARGVPSRAFMSIDFKSYISKQYKEIARKVFITLLTRNIGDVNRELKRIGTLFEGEIEDIIFWYPGSNSLSWAAEKGRNDPLRYTDTMLESVASRVRIGSKVISKSN